MLHNKTNSISNKASKMALIDTRYPTYSTVWGSNKWTKPNLL